MFVLVRKRNLIHLLSAVFIISFSWGIYELAAHPMLGKWQKEKIIISRVNTDKLIIALTFDDGPVYDKISAVLDALQRNQIKALFFDRHAKSRTA